MVSCNGRFTNLVYLAGGPRTGVQVVVRGRRRGGRDIERECAASTNNADLWFLRAILSRGSTSNQVSYMRTAARLAPDAVLPQVVLAQLLMQDKQSREAKTLITATFDRVTSPEQIQVWAQTAVMMAMQGGGSRSYMARPDDAWLKDFLAAHTNAIQAQFAQMIMGFYSPDQNRAKALQAARTVCSTSNDQFRAATVETLFAMKQRSRLWRV